MLEVHILYQPPSGMPCARLAVVHPHRELIERFYQAFAERDADSMVACYHPAVHFTDEVFDLHGADAGAMWRMLCARGEDLVIEYRNVEADDAGGRAHWDASYTFSTTGRQVRNSIDARFEFREGLIVRHVDSFDFWKWSRQALGLPGLLLGWSGLLKSKVAREAALGLERFVSGRSQGASGRAGQP